VTTQAHIDELVARFAAARARSRGLQEAASFALACIPSEHPEPCGTDACWPCAAEARLREALAGGGGRTL
jgi:hypothetical protein